MHKLDEEVEDILQHFGIKGMRWGVRNEERPAGKTTKKSPPKSKKNKLDDHESLAKFGKEKLKEHRKYKTKFDIDHIDAKTGEYSHQSKAYKVARAVNRTLEIGGALTAVAVTALLAEGGML